MAYNLLVLMIWYYLPLSQMTDDPFGGDEVDNLDCNMEISDRLKHLIAGLQKNITRIITLSNDDLQVRDN